MGSEGKEREEDERDFEAVAVEKGRNSMTPAGEEPLWKLWGLCEVDIGTKKHSYSKNENSKRKLRKKKNNKSLNSYEEEQCIQIGPKELGFHKVTPVMLY